MKKDNKPKDLCSNAFYATNDGIWEWNISTSEVYYSPKLKEMLGYNDTEINNELTVLQKLIHPDDQEYVNNQERKLILGEIKSYYVELRLLCKDGSYKWILSRAKPVEFDKNGKPLRVVGTHLDISYKKEYEQELKETKKYLMDIFNINPNITFMTDGEHLLKANEEFLKFTRFENIDEFKKEYDCICDMFEEQDNYITKYVDGELWINYVYNNKDKDNQALIIIEGRNYIFKIKVKKINNEYLVSLFDITSLIEKDKLLFIQSRSAAMGEMISMIAHQWRQPLAALSMEANIMMADYQLGIVNLEDFNTHSKSILEQIKYLSTTIDDFSNFFKPKSTKEEIDIKDIINDTLRFIEKSFENNNINIELDLIAIGKVQVFINELSHVIINILKNAKDALEASTINEKTIFIRTYKKDQLYIEIEDTAGGIDNKIIHKIFEPYFSTKDQLNGTGLGLYMSKMIIEDHFKGELSVVNVNKGAKFTIKIPIS